MVRYFLVPLIGGMLAAFGFLALPEDRQTRRRLNVLRRLQDAAVGEEGDGR